MKPTVYIETTVVSYLMAWPSRNVLRLSHEMLTRQWWTHQRSCFELYISQAVLDEASAGDPVAAAERIEALHGITVLPIDDRVIDLARQLAKSIALPKRALGDSLHMAATAVHGVAYLLTWNCRHMANAVLADRISLTCERNGYIPPRIVTPEQLISLR